jgi:hypothetical protein
MKDPEAPDADVQEQEADARIPLTEPEHPDVDPEVPEADAIEQAQPAPYDEEEFE